MTDENTNKPDPETPEQSNPEAEASGAGAPPPPPPPAPETPPPGTNKEDTTGPSLDAAEIENGKTFAILSYALSFIGLPFFLVPVITRDNEYSLFHAKQAMMIWLAGIILGAVSAVLTVICIGPIIGLVGGLLLLVLNIMGLIQTINGKAEPLPLLGPYAVNWFKGLTTVKNN